MLSQLAASYFARSPVLIFPILALAIFFAVFVAVSLHAARKKPQELARLAALPLSDSELEHHG